MGEPFLISRITCMYRMHQLISPSACVSLCVSLCVCAGAAVHTGLLRERYMYILVYKADEY